MYEYINKSSYDKIIKYIINYNVFNNCSFNFWWRQFKNFIVTLLVGMVTGTYSSVFIATPIVYLLNKNRNNIDKMREKEKKKKKHQLKKYQF